MPSVALASIRRVRVVVPVSCPDRRVDDLVALAATWPDVVVDLVWNGDPHLRPPGRWVDTTREMIGGPATGLVRAALDPRLRGLVLALDVIARGDAPALVLDAGCAVVRRPVELPADAVGVLARGAPPVDGLAPAVPDLARWGTFSTAVLSASPSIATDLVDRLVDVAADVSAGSALAAALVAHPVVVLPGEVVGWPLAAGVDPDAVALVDLTHVDRDEPWRLDVGHGRPRMSLSQRPDLRAHLAAPSGPPDLRTPGGIELDDVMRSLVSVALRAARRGVGELPPDPWGEPAAFVDWLESPANPWEPDVGRYWSSLWWSRPDLRSAFPDPAGADLVAFREWADHRTRFEGTSPYLRSVAPRFTTPWATDGRRPGGVDLVGYFGAEVSLGNVADRLLASLDAVGIPCRTLDLRRTGSPRRARTVDDVLGHDTVIVVANHDQVPPLLARHGDVLAGRRLIGYWYWDVEHVPDEVAARMRPFEQIWVNTRYTERSLTAVPGAPVVRSLSLPVPEPVVSTASRADLGLPTDRQVVLVTFDHLSVTERKNPLGAIEAFRRAFPEPTEGGPVLVIKTMNADQRWAEHERVRVAAMDRPDVVVVDRLLSKADQMALVGHADVLLSLHRAEGFGLHLVEAMWLGTPTIATRYSGNLAFMDDDCSLLVDARMVPVERGEGFFPPEASWADPDLDQAATHLRRLLADPDLARRLAAEGRARMERQPSFEQTGRTIAAWCGIEVR
jgi:glycosyltransferase involved in cell wall biosynthesis